MELNRNRHNRVVYSLALLSLFFAVSCATVRVNTLPPPPPTAKLRVFVQPFTGPGRWLVPHEVFVKNQILLVERHLEATGIYEVVNSRDVHEVVGDQALTRDRMQRNDWKLAREIGSALHADYVMIMERAKKKGAVGEQEFVFNNVMINTRTGKRFESHTNLGRITKSDRSQMKEIARKTYRDIFNSAKQDMLATAITKSEHMTSPKETVAVPPLTVEEPKSAAASAPKKDEQPAPVKGSKQEVTPEEQAEATQEPQERELVKETEAERALTQESVPGGRTKLVVYDLEAPEHYRPVALILTEALREELFLLKRFIVVNRENLEQVLKEMALQQTGLIDEKDAVKTGKGLATNQIVTGRLGMLGRTYVLQAKRVDLETLATLGLVSTRFAQGQEDEVLSRLPGLARGIAGLP
jgi:hypothetical protein